MIAATRATMLGSSFALLGGCVLDPISIITDPIMYAADAAGPTEAEYKAQNDAAVRAELVKHYRGQTCDQITLMWPERKAAVAADPTQWGGPVALSAAEQVAAEKGCKLPGESVAATPAAAAPAPVERDPASFAAVLANPPAGWGPVSPKGTRQMSLAQWVARETPERYQGRSCDYLSQSLAITRRYEASAEPGSQAWGASKRVAVKKALEGRNCPEWTADGMGRTGLRISDVDPIKAPLLGMPPEGASVEGLIPGSNGERAGMQFADIIVAVDSAPVADAADFLSNIGRKATGSTSVLKVWRRNTFITVPVLVGPPLTPPASVASKPSTPAAATGQSLADMQIAAVSADYAKAVGLPEAKGAWVIETVKGGQAERAGLKALDVIIEVSGQEVSSPADLAAIGEKMRKGYNAPVVVWRNGGKKDLKLVLR